jgi:hypothetical protein
LEVDFSYGQFGDMTFMDEIESIYDEGAMLDNELNVRKLDIQKVAPLIQRQDCPF